MGVDNWENIIKKKKKLFFFFVQIFFEKKMKFYLRFFRKIRFIIENPIFKYLLVLRSF